MEEAADHEKAMQKQPLGGDVSMWRGAHAGSGSLVGTVSPGGPSWSSPFLKDCTPWYGPAMEHLLKNCGPWEAHIGLTCAEPASPRRDPVLEQGKGRSGRDKSQWMDCNPQSPSTCTTQLEELGVRSSLGSRGLEGAVPSALLFFCCCFLFWFGFVFCLFCFVFQFSLPCSVKKWL